MENTPTIIDNIEFLQTGETATLGSLCRNLPSVSLNMQKQTGERNLLYLSTHFIKILSDEMDINTAYIQLAYSHEHNAIILFFNTNFPTRKYKLLLMSKNQIARKISITKFSRKYKLSDLKQHVFLPEKIIYHGLSGWIIYLDKPVDLDDYVNDYTATKRSKK